MTLTRIGNKTPPPYHQFRRIPKSNNLIRDLERAVHKEFLIQQNRNQLQRMGRRKPRRRVIRLPKINIGIQLVVKVSVTRFNRMGKL